MGWQKDLLIAGGLALGKAILSQATSSVASGVVNTGQSAITSVLTPAAVTGPASPASPTSPTPIPVASTVASPLSAQALFAASQGNALARLYPGSPSRVGLAQSQ
jgi:hypothetical protein